MTFQVEIQLIKMLQITNSCLHRQDKTFNSLQCGKMRGVKEE
jgi:hypothetical protein